MDASNIVERIRLVLPEDQRAFVLDASSDVDVDALVPKLAVVESADADLQTLRGLQQFVAERIRALQGVNLQDVMVTLRPFDDGPKHPDFEADAS